MYKPTEKEIALQIEVHKDVYGKIVSREEVIEYLTENPLVRSSWRDEYPRLDTFLSFFSFQYWKLYLHDKALDYAFKYYFGMSSFERGRVFRKRRRIAEVIRKEMFLLEIEEGLDQGVQRIWK